MAEQKRGTALSKTRGLFLSGYYYDRVVWGSGVSFVVVIALLVAFQARFEINLEKTILLTELSGLFASLALAVPIVARDDNEGNLLRRALLLLATTFVLSTIVSFAGALSTSGPAEVKLTVFGFAVLALVALPTSTLHTLIPRFEFSTGLLLFLSAIPTNFSAVIVGLVMFLWGAVQLVALVLVLAFRGRVANDPSTSVMSMIQSILEDEVRRTLSAQEILRKLAARAIFVSPDALQALLGTMNAEVNPEKPRLVRLAHDKYIASWRSEYHDRIVSRLPGILDSPSFRDAMERDGDTTYRRIGAAAGLSEELVKAYPDLQGILETGYVIVRLSPDAALVRKDLAESIRAMFDSADSLRNFFKAFQSCEALLGQEADDSGSNVGRICEEISLQYRWTPLPGDSQTWSLRLFSSFSG